MLSQALDKATPNSIKSSAAPLAYKALQHVITGDCVWKILEHLLIHSAPHIGGKANDPQDKIYDLNLIPE